MSPQMESLMKSKHTMADVHSTAQRFPQMKTEFKESMEKVINLLNSWFQRMSLKGSELTTHEGVDASSVDSFFEYLHVVDATPQQDALRRSDLKKCFKFQEFCAKHCKVTQYTFQIQKCSAEDCEYCQTNPPSLPPEVFADMHFLPSPMLATGDKYKKFEDIYGTSTTEKDLPSRQGCGDKAADETHKYLLNAGKVRGAVMCGECQKPRCIYSATKLSDAEANAVEQAKESNVYTCGSELLSQDHHLASAVIVRITCQSPIETTYYAATHVHFPDACYYCGETDADLLLDDPYIKELKQQFGTVRPLCRQCRNAGKEAKTRAPNCAKRRKLD